MICRKAAPPAELLEEKEEADFAEKQEVFEYKYNTRFENPDHHFVSKTVVFYWSTSKLGKHLRSHKW